MFSTDLSTADKKIREKYINKAMFKLNYCPLNKHHALTLTLQYLNTIAHRPPGKRMDKTLGNREG